ncbi:hypothetical protein SAMN04487895_104268 [Paenibacillus sophorae]|uniref:Uncharacterized protein n=1 Tax=Paenibacillus sophorae TaxID=1333845 RepID=A0A1H8LCG3_9BACL|nr:hypothetical protein [Paenibacillus sophorae]QWU17348.1 hypothetical protein KP014_09450 [Paenibacillus sophorae]SEO02506.1 hypothetical protein SAMN04487895_104268 [Paenibacillus sophorae]
MRGTHSFLLDEEVIGFEINPETHYNPPVLAIQQGNQSIQLHLSNEQLADLEFTIRTHLDSIRYPETPDQQMILHAECNAAIEEEIA